MQHAAKIFHTSFMALSLMMVFRKSASVTVSNDDAKEG